VCDYTYTVLGLQGTPAPWFSLQISGWGCSSAPSGACWPLQLWRPLGHPEQWGWHQGPGPEVLALLQSSAFWARLGGLGDVVKETGGHVCLTWRRVEARRQGAELMGTGTWWQCEDAAQRCLQGFRRQRSGLCWVGQWWVPILDSAPREFSTVNSPRHLFLTWRPPWLRLVPRLFPASWSPPHRSTACSVLCPGVVAVKGR
jgi:hypothetical protein